MENNYRVTVGSNNYQPWNKLTREELVSNAQKLGFGEGFIEELSDKELFNMVILEGCRKAEKEK